MLPDAETHAGCSQTHYFSAVPLSTSCFWEQSLVRRCFQISTTFSLWAICLPIHPLICPSIYPFIRQSVYPSMFDGVAQHQNSSQSVNSWGFLFQKRSHNLEKKKQEAQHVSCWTVRKTDRANKHSCLQTHPHAGTASVLTFSTSVLHHLVLMCQSDHWRRHPSYSVTFKHLPPPHQSQLTHFVIHQPDGSNLFFLFFYINVFLQVKQKQHTYTCGEITFVFPHVHLNCILMFDLGFDVFQVIANVAFLKCSSSFALSYIFMAFKGAACRIYYHLVVQNHIANNVNVNPSVSVSLEKNYLHDVFIFA